MQLTIRDTLINTCVLAYVYIVYYILTILTMQLYIILCTYNRHCNISFTRNQRWLLKRQYYCKVSLRTRVGFMNDRGPIANSPHPLDIRNTCVQFTYISPRVTHIALPIINGGVRPRTISETNSRIRIIHYIEYLLSKAIGDAR